MGGFIGVSAWGKEVSVNTQNVALKGDRALEMC